MLLPFRPGKVFQSRSIATCARDNEVKQCEKLRKSEVEAAFALCAMIGSARAHGFAAAAYQSNFDFSQLT